MFLPYLLLLLPAASRPLEVQNGSVVELHCRPAELFVRTHMAPDFETPQLIRRLDWFHNDALVASFEQSVHGDAARQWWVSGAGLQLLRPFYSLRIVPVLPEHAGAYKCRLETDPLFSLSLSTATVNLAVLLRPVAPSQPDVRGVTNSSVTLAWSHPTARAHRPILRYSVLVRHVPETVRGSTPTASSEFIIPAPSNATSVIVDNLLPSTTYAFCVRAENAAGASDFGPERIAATKGQPPSSAAEVTRVEATSSCVRLLLRPPPLLDRHGALSGFWLTLEQDAETTRKRSSNNSAAIVIFHNVSSSSSPSSLDSEWAEACGLEANAAYSATVEAANAFGRSPPVRLPLHTDQGVPDAPSSLRLRPSIGQAAIAVHWRAPVITRGDLTHFNIYYKRNGAPKWAVEQHAARPAGSQPQARTHSHRMEIKGLEPSTRYTVKVSASTIRGEGNTTAELSAVTDIPVPPPLEIANLTIDCAISKVRIEWKKSAEAFMYQLRVVNSSSDTQFNTTATFLDLLLISFDEEYIVHLFSLARSTLDSSILLQSLASTPHRFLLKEGCILHSSLCTSTERCQPLRASAPTGRLALMVIASLIAVFLICTLLVALLLKHNCVDLKRYIKKKEKCVHIDELTPLVYDAAGCEDVPVELFYGMCEDFARDDHRKYKQLFDKINDITELEEPYEGVTPTEIGVHSRDRYQNVTATEATRIRIQDETTGSDYINANFIDSCETRRAYIATQAPLPHTFAHFWSMCWQERVNVIVVITNLVEDGRRKCDQYWPSSSAASQQHGGYVVSLVSQTTNAHFVHRVLSLRIAKSLPPTERRVHQVHFTGWPDHGVPASVFPLLSFMHFVAQLHSTGPVLVHCSAGIGRSGSFILIDSMRRRLLKHRTLNLAGHLLHMRKQREKLVQTLEQFVFCHEVVRQLARHGITRVPATLFPRYVQFLSEESFNGRRRLEQQFDDICRCTHQPRCTPVTQQPVLLPGFHRLDEFLVGHWPSECAALWQAVWEHDCKGVLIVADEESAEHFWTRESGRVDDVFVEHADERHVTLSSDDGETLSVCLLRISPAAMDLSTWSELERVQTQRGSSHDAPLLLVCPATTQHPPPALLQPASVGTTSMGAVVTGAGSGSGGSCMNTLTRRQREMCSTALSRPFVFCALTSLACQLEQHGALDVVQTLSAHAAAHCGAFADKHVIEYIYERLLQLVNMNKSS